MSIDRGYHDCAILKNQAPDGGQYVVVAGGYSYDGSWSKVDKVEVYNIADNTWFDGPDMPERKGVSKTHENGRVSLYVLFTYIVSKDGDQQGWKVSFPDRH